MPDIFDTISEGRKDIFNTISVEEPKVNKMAEIEKAVGPAGTKFAETPSTQWSLADIGRIPGRVGGTLKMGGLQAGESMARAVQHGAEFLVKETFPDIKDEDIRSFFEASATYPVGAAKHEKFLSDVTRIPDMLADVAQAKREKILTGRPQFKFRESPILYATELVGQNLPTTAIALGAGILGGPAVGLGVMGASEFGSAAEQQAQTGASIEKQTLIGTLSGAAEIGGEMLVFPKILKGVKGGGFTVRQIVDTMLENAGQEGITGFAQQFLQTFGTETSKGTSIKDATQIAFGDGLAAIPENAWVGAVTAGFTTSATTVAGRSLDMIRHITAVKDTIENPQVEDIADIDAKIVEVQEDKTIPEEQKKILTGFLGGIIGNWETKLVDKIPGEITDLKSLEEWGNKVAKELGVDTVLEKLAKKHGIQSNIVWQKDTRSTVSKRAHAEGPEIGGPERRYGVKIFDFNRLIKDQTGLKETIIHELGHFARRPFRLATQYSRGKRQIHHPEFKSWVDASVKQMFQEKRTFVPSKEQGPPGEIPIIAPQGEIPVKGSKVTFNGSNYVIEDTFTESNDEQWVTLYDEENGVHLPVRVSDLNQPQGETVADGIFHRETGLSEIDNWLKNPEYAAKRKGRKLEIVQMSPDEYLDRVGQMQNVSRERTNQMVDKGSLETLRKAVNEGKTLDMPYLDYVRNAQEGRARAQLAKDLGQEQIPVLVITTQAEIAAAKPAPVAEKAGPTKKQLLAEGHKIQREHGVSDKDYRDLAKEITGKWSMKDMSMKQKSAFVDALREKYGAVTGLTEEDLERSIPFRGKMTPLKQIFTDVIATIDAAPDAKKIPASVSVGTPAQGIKKIVIGAWRTFVGIRGSRPGRLAKMLGGFKDSIVTEIFRGELIERGGNTKAIHNKAFYEAFQNFLIDNEITSEMMAKFSRTQHRWWAPIEAIKELMGYGPDKIVVEVNGRGYSITRDNLLDLYLQIRQPDGLGHVVQHGFVIGDVHTGSVSVESGQLQKLMEMANADPLIQKMIEFWDTIAPFYVRDPVNNTSQMLVGKDIATKELWYSLDVEKTRRTTKQGFALRVSKRIFNIIEDQSILQPRKGPTGALVMGSFLDTMESVEEGVSDYVAYAPTLRLARTILGHQGIADAWRKKGYTDAYDNLVTIIENEMALPEPKGALENFILAITRGAVRGLLHFNLRTAGVQISSTAMLAKDFDAKYITSGLEYATTHKMGDQFFKVIPWAWARYFMDRGPRQIGGLAETSGLTLPMQGKLAANQATGILLKKSDLEPFHVIFGAAIAEYADAQKGKLKPDSLAAKYWTGRDVSFEEGSQEWAKAIEDRFTVGRRGQQSYDKFDRSVNTSAKGTVSKIGFLFQSFHEGAKNSIQESIDDWVHSGKTEQDTKTASRKIGAVLASYIAEQLLRDSITMAMFLTVGAIFKKKYKTLRWYEWPLRAITSALDMIPLIGNYTVAVLRNFARTLAGDKPIYGGRLGEPLPLQIINTVAQAPDNFGQAVGYYLRGDSEKGNKAMFRAINKTYEGIALPSGMPVYEIRRFQTQIEEEPTGKRGGDKSYPYRPGKK